MNSLVGLVALLIFADCVFSESANSTIDNTAVAREIHELIQKNPVTLFSKTFCPYSKKVKKILEPYQIKNMKVVELDLRKDGAVVQDELKSISKMRTVPQLFVNGKFVGNHDMVSKMQKDNKLRPMLEEAKIIQPTH